MLLGALAPADHPAARRGRRAAECLTATLLLLVAAVPLHAQDSGAGARDASHPSFHDGVVAVVEGVPITRHELELSCRLRNDYRGLRPGDPERARIEAEELDQLIEQHVLVSRAQQAKITFTDQDQKRLDQELNRAAQDYHGLDGLQQALQAIGVPYPYFVARQKANLLVQKLLVKSISRDIFVTPAEIRRAYQEHLGRYQRPGEVRYRQIVVYPDPSYAYRMPLLVKHRVDAGRWKAQAFAEALRARILKGEPFAKVAREASMGVEFDQVVKVPLTGSSLRDVMKPPLGETLDALQPGQVSKVVKTSRGTRYLLLLVDRRKPGVLPLEEVQGQIESELKEKVWKERIHAWIDHARSQADVQVFLPRTK